jgi:hypothetical protein
VTSGAGPTEVAGGLTATIVQTGALTFELTIAVPEDYGGTEIEVWLSILTTELGFEAHVDAPTFYPVAAPPG